MFPSQSRSFKGQRWTSILLRTLHLMGISGVGAGFLFSIPQHQWLPYMYLTVGSGSAMVVLEVWSNGIWLLQLRGIATLLKLLLLGITLITGLQPYILFGVILLSGLMSHAPGKLRYFSFIRTHH